jgi:GT2 family glycosyltransferase
MGFGYACNQGYQIATNNTIMFLNNDIKILDKSSSWITNLVDFVQDHDNMLIGPTAGYVDPETYAFKYETETEDKPYNYMSGWCLTATKQTFDRLVESPNLGPFNADKYFAYFEDTHLGFLAKKLDIDFKLYPVPLKHFGKMTSTKLNMNKLYTDSKYTFIQTWLNNA